MGWRTGTFIQTFPVLMVNHRYIKHTGQGAVSTYRRDKTEELMLLHMCRLLCFYKKRDSSIKIHQILMDQGHVRVCLKKSAPFKNSAFKLCRYRSSTVMNRWPDVLAVVTCVPVCTLVGSTCTQTCSHIRHVTAAAVWSISLCIKAESCADGLK